MDDIDDGWVVAAETERSIVVHFTEAEHAFFATGEALATAPVVADSFDDLDVAPPRTFWQRLFER
jgi:hypothetical protein